MSQATIAGVSTAPKKTDLVVFGTYEILDGNLEIVVLEFDYKSFVLNKYLETVRIQTLSFGDIKKVQTDNETIVVQFSPGINPSSFVPCASEIAVTCIFLSQQLSIISRN